MCDSGCKVDQKIIFIFPLTTVEQKHNITIAKQHVGHVHYT